MSQRNPGNSAWIGREEQFVNHGWSQWNITSPNDFPTKVRSPKGTVLDVIIPQKRYTTWYNTVRKFLGRSVAGSFKPTRHSTVELTKPLYITSLTNRENLIHSRFKIEVGEFIKEAIARANQSSRENDLGWELCYWENVEKPQGYLEVCCWQRSALLFCC
jgi:hypothetical protein